MSFKRLSAAVACTVVMAGGYTVNATTDPSDPETSGVGSSPSPPATSSTAPNQCSDVSGESPSAEPPADTQAPAPSGATLTADYGFEGSLESSVGGVPDLTEVGDVATGYADEAVLGQTRPVLTFQYPWVHDRAAISVRSHRRLAEDRRLQPGLGGLRFVLS
jgi:hypothetical protein